MAYQYISTEIFQSCGIITLNRPEALNAFNESMGQEIAEQIYNFENDESVKTILLRGSDKAFAAGVDMDEFIAQINDGFYDADNYNIVFNELQKCQKPVLAEVSGLALGIGCELALACDIILASDEAQFGMPETSLGLIPSFGGISRFLRTLGKAQTMDILMSGKALTAEEAHMGGLISRICPLKDVHKEALKLAEKIGKMPASTLGAIKNCCRFSFANPFSGSIEYERQCAKTITESAELRERLENLPQKNALTD